MANWKKGRGKLGVLAPLLGTWRAEEDSPRGLFTCTRRFTSVLEGNYIELCVDWQFTDSLYQEKALLGVDKEKILTFWSFTSDGKQSVGHVADGTDLHPQALCFEAQMPAGLARMVYWPDDADGFFWAVESKTQKGWNRFQLHHYHPYAPG